MKTKSFIEESTRLLLSVGKCTGDEARLAHRLSRALDKLQVIVNQANAQFNCGDRHATFNKQTITEIESDTEI